MKQKGRRITVTKCRSCQASIVFLLTSNGKPIPVNFSSLTNSDRYDMSRGGLFMFRFRDHKTHFGTCKKQAENLNIPSVDNRYNND